MRHLPGELGDAAADLELDRIALDDPVDLLGRGHILEPDVGEPLKGCRHVVCDELLKLLPAQLRELVLHMGGEEGVAQVTHVGFLTTSAPPRSRRSCMSTRSRSVATSTVGWSSAWAHASSSSTSAASER